MSKRMVLAGLAALLGCGTASAATNPSNGLSLTSSLSLPEGWVRLQAAYADQKDGLQRDLGNNVFVASYKSVAHDGRLVTFSIWTDSVPTVLPKTDFVWLQDAKMTRWFVVPWSDLEAAIGKLPALQRADPPRYLTPANIPRSYFNGLKKTFVPPQGFPERIASGRR